MTKLQELKQDLESAQAGLKRMQDPKFNAKAQQGRYHRPYYDMNPNVVIPSYTKIIKELKSEIKALEDKKPAKKTPAKKKTK